MKSNRSVVIADNQDITYAGLKFLHGNIFPRNPITRVGNKEELISFLSSHPEAMVVLDYSLFNFQSIDEFLIFCERFPFVYWLLFSDDFTLRLIQLMACSSYNVGILLKSCTAQEIEDALKRGYSNENYICKAVSLMLDSHVDVPKITLTATEKEILKLIASGLTTKEIAEKRFLSTHTVITHRKNIFRKIDVNNIHEATRYAVRMGLVDLTEYYI